MLSCTALHLFSVLIRISMVSVRFLRYFGKQESIGPSTQALQKSIVRKKISGTKIQIMVQNILYQYLVVLNVKIRNRSFGQL